MEEEWSRKCKKCLCHVTNSQGNGDVFGKQVMIAHCILLIFDLL